MKCYLIALLVVAATLLAGAAVATEGKDAPLESGHLGNSHTAIQADEQFHSDQLETITIIDYSNGTVAMSSSNGPLQSVDATGYKLMGVKWKKFPVNWSIDDSNYSDPMTSAQQFRDMVRSLREWDLATSRNLVRITERFRYISGIDTGWFTGNPDGWNTIEMDAVGYINEYYGPGVISVTRVYTIPAKNKIVEADILLNDNKYSWSSLADPRPGTMIVRNIGTHGAGHAFGLLNLNNAAFAEATMYRLDTSIYGETKKCSLWTGDIAGIQTLYGV